MIEIHKKMEPDEADTREMKGKRQEEQKVQREQQRKEPMPELKHQKLTAQAEKRRERNKLWREYGLSCNDCFVRSLLLCQLSD